MFFRILIFATLLGVQGCDWVGENRQIQSFSIAGKLSGCLTGYEKKIVDYFNGQYRSNPEVIGDLFDCGSQALKYFVDHERGAVRGEYDPKELQTFLHRYFFDQQKINDSFLQEIMALKVALLGGSAQKFTRIEIDQIRSLLKDFKAEAIRLNAFMPLSVEHLKSIEESNLEKLLVSLTSSARNLGASLEKAAGDYPTESLDRLLSEFESALVLPKDRETVQIIRKHIPVFQVLKGILLGGKRTVIGKGEWKLLIELHADLATEMFRYAHFNHQYESWAYGDGLKRWAEIVKASFGFLARVIRNQPDQMLSFQQWYDLIDAAKDARVEWLPPKRSDLKNIIPKAFRKMLAGKDMGNQGRNSTGLTLGHLARISEAFEHWAMTQAELERLYRHLGGDLALRSRGFFREDLLRGIQELAEKEKPDLSSLGILGWKSKGLIEVFRLAPENLLKNLIETHKPFFRPGDPIVFLSAEDADTRYSHYHLSRLNWIRSIVLFLLPGYVEEPERIVADQLRINVTELHEFYTDIFPIAREYGAVHPDSVNDAKNRFVEGSLFTFQSDGDGFLSESEIVELVAFLLSGQATAERFHYDIAKSKYACPVGPVDEVGWPTIDYHCWKDNFQARFTSYFDHLPGWGMYFFQLGQTPERDKFFEFYEHASRSPLRWQEPLIGGPDAKGFGVVPHYIEAILARFDHDQSGDLAMNETLEAIEVYRYIISKISKRYEPNDPTILPLFVWMLENGDFPQTPFDKIAFLKFKNGFDPSVYKMRGANRYRITQILAMVAQKAGEAAAEKIRLDLLQKEKERLEAIERGEGPDVVPDSSPEVDEGVLPKPPRKKLTDEELEKISPSR